MNNPHIGSTFDQFLNEDGIGDAVQDLAQRRVIAWQLERAMRERGIAKTELARRMGTSRAQLDRIFDPANTRVQLDTLQRAARALGRRLKV